MLYMVVEQYRNGDAVPVYRRFRDQGRLMSDGLRYVASWVTEDLRRCFQIMECDDPSLLARWTAHWEDGRHGRSAPVGPIFLRLSTTLLASYAYKVLERAL